MAPPVGTPISPPGPWASGYVYPPVAADAPPGPWAFGYHPPQPPMTQFPPSTPPPQPRDSSQTPLGTPPPAADPNQNGANGGGFGLNDPDYQGIVKNYLSRLTRPTPYPMPTPLTGTQALAVEMNPDRRQELLSTFNRPYAERMAAFQYGEQREGRAATIASTMARAQAMERYRAMVAQNLALYRQGLASQGAQRTRSLQERTDAYVNRTQRGVGPQDWEKQIAGLDRELAQAARDVSAGHGRALLPTDPNVDTPSQKTVRSTLGDTDQRYRDLRDLRTRIQKVTSNPEFQQRSREFQNRVVERLLSGYGQQQTPQVPPPPPEDDEEEAEDFGQ